MIMTQASRSAKVHRRPLSLMRGKAHCDHAIRAGLYGVWTIVVEDG
jgi:hypothetical protein